MIILIPLFIIQPLLILWLIYKLQLFINKLSYSKNETNIDYKPWLMLLIITAIIAPTLGFNFNASEEYSHPDSWGGDSMFRVFANKYWLDLGIFYYTTIVLIIFGFQLSKLNKIVYHITNGLIISLILLSVLSSIQLGPLGCLLISTPILGLLLATPIINIFLFYALLICNIKNNTYDEVPFFKSISIAIGITLLYCILFQFGLEHLSTRENGLINVFLHSKDGFIPKLFNFKTP